MAPAEYPHVLEVHRVFGLGTMTRKPPILPPIRLPREGITFITGYSGCGKTTLVQRILNELGGNARTLGDIPDPESPPISLFPCGLRDALRWLGGFGLAEAMLLVTPYRALSEGEKLRLRLALLMWPRPGIVVVDEFLSLLDRVTAKTVAYNFQKICRRLGTTAYLATGHDDLIAPLAPDHVVRLDLHGKTAVVERLEVAPVISEMADIAIVAGSREDFDALSRFHYADDSAIDWDDDRTRVLAARLHNETVGVVVFGPPLPFFHGVVPLLETLNRTVIVVARTIVHPAFRGIGLTRRLTPPLSPETKLISSFSALGKYVPFHLAKGFVAVEHPRNRHRPDHRALEGFLVSSIGADLSALYDYKAAQAVVDAMNDGQIEQTRELVSRIIVTDNVEYCLFLARAAGLRIAPSTRRELQTFFGRIVAQVPNSTFGPVLAEALHFPMQGFVRKVDSAARDDSEHDRRGL